MDNETDVRLAKLHSTIHTVLNQRSSKADEYLLARDSGRVKVLESILAFVVDECGRRGTIDTLLRVSPLLESLIKHPAISQAVHAVSKGMPIERVNDMLVSVVLMSRDVRTVGLVERFRRALVRIALRWDEPLPEVYERYDIDLGHTPLHTYERPTRVGTDTVFLPNDKTLFETEQVSGNLYILGDLQPATDLAVDGDLHVFGSLRSPRVSVTGTVWIRDAVLGNESHRIVCEGNLDACVVRGIECRCGDAVSVGLMMYTTVFANEINADAIIGGSLHGTHIHVRETGSQLHISTRVFVNVRDEFSVRIESCAHPNTIIFASDDDDNETFSLAQVQVRGAAWSGPCHLEFDGRNWNVKRSLNT